MCHSIEAIGGVGMFVFGMVVGIIVLIVATIMVGSGREAEQERKRSGEP